MFSELFGAAQPHPNLTLNCQPDSIFLLALGDAGPFSGSLAWLSLLLSSIYCIDHLPFISHAALR
jgi:hypothetical protein